MPNVAKFGRKRASDIRLHMGINNPGHQKGRPALDRLAQYSGILEFADGVVLGKFFDWDMTNALLTA